MQFQTTSRRKKGNEITKSSRLEFSEKFLANNFALSDAEVNTSTLLNWGGKADLLLLRTLLASSLKCWDPCFWEVMDYFVLLAYPSLGASRTLLQRLLARLNFTLGSKDLFFWYKWKKSLQWTMDMSETWPDTYEGYVYINSNLNPRSKFKSGCRNTTILKISSFGTSLK